MAHSLGSDISRGDELSGYQKVVEKASEAVLGIMLITELVILFGNIVSRELFGHSFAWAEEVAGLALASLTFIGGAIAYQRGEHMSVRAIIDRLPAGWHPVVKALETWIVFVMAVGGIALMFTIFPIQWSGKMPVLGLRLSWIYLPFTIGMVLLALFALERLGRLSWRVIVGAGIVVLAFVAFLVIAQGLTGPWDSASVLSFTLVVFLVMLALGVPIGFVLPMASMLYLYSTKVSPVVAIPIGMQSGVSGFVMLAIPFFILAGNVMTEGGLARPLADWALTLVGRMRGGLLQALVTCMFIFSGISGAKVADVAAVGTTMRDMLEEQGYEPAETVSVLAASAIMGETIPPSIAMLVMGSITSLSVGALFMAGVLPAIVLAIALMLLIYVRAQILGMPRSSQVSWGERGKTTLKAIPALFVPVLLVLGIVGGIATPTEASSVAVVYALVISTFVYKGMNFRTFMKALADAGSMAGMILFIISAGSAFSWSLTVANVPHRIAGLIIDLGGSKTLFLVITIVALTIMGELLEGLPALLTFGPILMPIAIQFGINPLQFSMILIVAMGMGAFAPPIGFGFYVACSVGNATMEQASRRIVPYLLLLTAGLLLIAFVPWFSLAIPRALHLIN